MFGEYMVYVDSKPLLLVCDNTVYVKMLDCVAALMAEAETGTPYSGAKPHYILDIDNNALSCEVVRILEPVTPLPKPRKRKN
jgi:TfoX/Sxy family transcriptional regulator of competence genes